MLRCNRLKPNPSFYNKPSCLSLTGGSIISLLINRFQHFRISFLALIFPMFFFCVFVQFLLCFFKIKFLWLTRQGKRVSGTKLDVSGVWSIERFLKIKEKKMENWLNLVIREKKGKTKGWKLEETNFLSIRMRIRISGTLSPKTYLRTFRS